MNIEICINTNNYSGKDVQIDSKDIIEITDETTDEELQGKILAMLIEQERKTGKDISKIIDNK